MIKVGPQYNSTTKIPEQDSNEVETHPGTLFALSKEVRAKSELQYSKAGDHAMIRKKK